MPENAKQFPHYFRRVPEHIDIYRVIDAWDVAHPALQHALKKILCCGSRGAKDQETDINEAIQSLERWQEMRKEDRALVADINEPLPKAVALEKILEHATKTRRKK